MDRLNLQLTPAFVGTRRFPRRVLWILIIVCFCTLLAAAACEAWFRKPITLEYVPQGSILAFQASWPIRSVPPFSNDLLSAPLLPRHLVTLADLLPNIRGNIAIHFLKNGSRVVLVIPKDKKTMVEQMNQDHIVTTSLSKRILALSESDMDFTPQKLHFSEWGTSWIGWGERGIILIPGDRPTFGQWHSDDAGWSFDIPITLTTPPQARSPRPKKLPTGLISFLSTQAWTLDTNSLQSFIHTKESNATITLPDIATFRSDDRALKHLVLAPGATGQETVSALSFFPTPFVQTKSEPFLLPKGRTVKETIMEKPSLVSKEINGWGVFASDEELIGQWINPLGDLPASVCWPADAYAINSIFFPGSTAFTRDAFLNTLFPVSGATSVQIKSQEMVIRMCR
ncbi:hypothetical protein HYV73_03455 [Candidatus Uhrbacteria bacterium]|nr:hypothetical protein [Candidatus Uhrbacteria bacterium]